MAVFSSPMVASREPTVTLNLSFADARTLTVTGIRGRVEAKGGVGRG
jgi:hypothetical protein